MLPTTIENKVEIETKRPTMRIQKLENDIDRLDRKIAHHVSEIELYTERWEVRHQQLKWDKEKHLSSIASSQEKYEKILVRLDSLNQEMDIEQQTADRARSRSSYREACQKTEKLEQRIKEKEQALQKYKNRIQNKSDKLNQLKSTIWSYRNRYTRRVELEKNAFSECEEDLARTYSEISILQAKVDGVRKDALQTPVRVSRIIAGHRVLICCGKNPRASLIPTPEKEHAVSPNPFNRSGKFNSKHPDYVHFPSPGITVCESELNARDIDSLQKATRLMADLQLTRERVKEDERFASGAKRSSIEGRWRHHRYTERTFRRADKRLRSLSQGDLSQSDLTHKLQGIAKSLHARHRSTGQMNGFPTRKLSLQN